MDHHQSLIFRNLEIMLVPPERIGKENIKPHNAGPSKLKETKHLMLDQSYRSRRFVVDFDKTIAYLGQHVADVIHHKVYDSNFVNCCNAILARGMKAKGFNTSFMIILKSDIFDNTDIRCLTQGDPEKTESIRLKRFKNAIISSMKFSQKFLRFAFISIRTNDHWHFLMWYKDENLYIHFDSNHKVFAKQNLEAALQTIFWFNHFIKEILNIKEHQSYQLLRSIPQEKEATCNGGLYMIEALRFVAYGVMQHQKANTKDLLLEDLYPLHWTKNKYQRLEMKYFRHVLQ
ncbi:hypothetical protein ZOSMA_175G00010 [Zostera marina]|uniref:Ubiquitin-like protease family profile domain-containing protein n=1 Tax=Zostera marina TaxID=29655 RepID=A0A0K9PRS2_ZOSMR|nr:hypothetical protein ZOSMA_175G00010 [Zostera marina]